MSVTGILWAVLIVASVGLFIGIFLGIASVIFKVFVNEKEEKRLYYKSLFDEAMAYELGERGFPINQQEAFKRYLACAEYYDEDPECEAARESLEMAVPRDEGSFLG